MNYHSDKYVVTALVTFLCVIQSFCQTTKADSILYDFNNNPEKILVAAHRATHQNYPENSIAAILESIRLGVDIIELDVRATKDGKLVVIHDRTVDRTTNGTGKVEKFKLEALRKLRLKQHDTLTEQLIPTFDEVLLAAKNHIMIDVDFKASAKHIDKAIALIEKHKMENQIIFFLYDHKLSPKLHKRNPRIQIMPRAHNKEEIEKILTWEYINVIHGDDSFYDDDLMKGIIDANIRVWMNALGKYDNMEKDKKNSGFDNLLQKKYLNIIQTDLPEELKNYLKKKNQKK